jgi:putative membrane protein
VARQLATILVLFVALIQTAIAVTEIFFLEFPVIYGRLHYNSEVARQAAPIVANAGLYNGLPGACLIWEVRSGARDCQIQTFFLICVVIAGVFGAVTLQPTTLLLQSVPGSLALLAVSLSRKPVEPSD